MSPHTHYVRGSFQCSFYYRSPVVKHQAIQSEGEPHQFDWYLPLYATDLFKNGRILMAWRTVRGSHLDVII